jgi:hypothetical protein
MIGICAGCGYEKKLVRSPVVPRSFFDDLNDFSAVSLKIYADTGDGYPKRSPIGIYDKEILCGECELMFQDLDNYAHRVLIGDVVSEELGDKDRPIALLLKNVDVRKLEKFMASVLWRASISGHDFYKRVELGPYLDAFKRIVWKQELNTNLLPGFILSKFNGAFGNGLMFDPHPERWYGVNYYRVYLGRYVAHIKVDKRTTPASLCFLDSKRFSNSLLVIYKDMAISRELRLAKKILENTQARNRN